MILQHYLLKSWKRWATIAIKYIRYNEDNYTGITSSEMKMNIRSLNLGWECIIKVEVIRLIDAGNSSHLMIQKAYCTVFSEHNWYHRSIIQRIFNIDRLIFPGLQLTLYLLFKYNIALNFPGLSYHEMFFRENKGTSIIICTVFYWICSVLVDDGRKFGITESTFSVKPVQ